MAERAEMSRTPITDAIRFLKSHGMTVEYDTPPERIGMMADFLSENGHDVAAKDFRKHDGQWILIFAGWEYVSPEPYVPTPMRRSYEYTLCEFLNMIRREQEAQFNGPAWGVLKYD